MAAVTPAPFAVTVGAVAASLSGLIARVGGSPAVGVAGLSQDSRTILPGEIFAARAGKSADGGAFIEAALSKGASALLLGVEVQLPATQVPIIWVSDIERAIPLAAEAAFGYPSQQLKVVGITGTNGKTTSTWLVQQALLGAGYSAASLGTLGFNFGGVSVDVGLTTPQADAVCRFEQQALSKGASHFVMEVSSHALLLNRVLGLKFSVGAFTNLTQDHLDFHGSLENYFLAKSKLFTELEPGVSVIHTTSPWGQRLVKLAKGRVITVGLQAGADVFPSAWQIDARSLTAKVELPSGRVEFLAPLVGKHNLENCLTALAIVEGLGLDVQAAAEALATVPQVPGRMERCDSEFDDVAVVVDYAHTPDALTRALSAARGVGQGRLVGVFGCGGDRDPTKRSLMGESVRAGADFAFITNDNPRSESPSLIARAIEVAFVGEASRYSVVLDRAEAITSAILGAASGDVILVAGKGHETYQIAEGVRSEFDDRVQARKALAQRRELGRRH